MVDQGTSQNGHQCHLAVKYSFKIVSITKRLLLKAAKYEIQKPSTCRATLFRCKFLSMFRVFHLA